MKATALISILLLLALVRSDKLFEEHTLLGASRENKDKKSDVTRVLSGGETKESPKGTYFVKLETTGDLILYKSKNESDDEQFIWSTNLGDEYKGVKRNAFITKSGQLILAKDKKSTPFWHAFYEDDKEAKKGYTLEVTEEGELCVFSAGKHRTIWCHTDEMEE